jgi:GT2 family glycosyltransferase
MTQPMALPGFAATWEKIPLPLSDALLLSSDGEQRLVRLASEAFEQMEQSSDPFLIGLVADLSLAAWECSLLSARAASLVTAIDEQRPSLRKTVAAFCAACSELRPSDAEDAAMIKSCISAGDMGEAKILTARHAAGEPQNLFWLYFAVYLGLQRGDLDWYETQLMGQRTNMPPVFASIFMADYLFAREDWGRAAELYAKAFIRTALPSLLMREGECRIRTGDRDGARTCWHRALTLRPWQSHLFLRLTDLERGSDLPGPPPSGKGEILLYSWNHAPDLDKSLEALAASSLGECKVSILDNGSEDNTPEVLRVWHDRLGERMRVITLPVNVGAPAARNWLLALPSSRAADWVVFLDDDALVPSEWLGFLGTALRQYPEAGVIGCRVVDAASPMTLQSVELHFDVVGRADENNGPKVVDSHLNGPDFGQYSYLRPAVSVTGCCHCITRKNIETTGPFDLRFSPSQFDDFERDLRIWEKNGFCLYQGHLRIRHIKRTGDMAGISRWQRASILGNQVKIRESYSTEELEKIARCAAHAIREDFAARQKFLAEIPT